MASESDLRPLNAFWPGQRVGIRGLPGDRATVVMLDLSAGGVIVRMDPAGPDDRGALENLPPGRLTPYS